MNLSDYFHAYSLDELAQGAECCYSGDLEQFSSEILSESEYTRCVEEGVLFPFQNHGEVQFSSASCKKVTWNGAARNIIIPESGFLSVWAGLAEFAVTVTHLRRISISVPTQRHS